MPDIPDAARELADAIRCRFPHDHLDLITAVLSKARETGRQQGLQEALSAVRNQRMNDPQDTKGDEIYQQTVDYCAIAVRGLLDAPPTDAPATPPNGPFISPLFNAADAAWNDARIFGIGYVAIFPDGRRERIPPEAVLLDRAALLKSAKEPTNAQR